MKKNRMMRIASVLLVAVLMSTCAISGTFAKYTTFDSGADTARVAKWGVVVEIDSDLDLFKEAYDVDADDAGNEITQTVKVDTEGTNLVAPGTTNSITFTIDGTPEVAVDIQFSMTVNSDVVIPENTDIGQGNPRDQDHVANILNSPYTPVVFTLTKTDGEEDQDTDPDVIATGTLATIKVEFDKLSKKYGPNTSLDETYTLSWEWAFDATANQNSNDTADTYLGNVMSGIVVDPNTKTGIDFEFSITVTQIN